MKKDYQTIKVSREGNVVTAALNRPESGNAINMKMVNELTDLMKMIDSAQDVDVLVFRAGGDVFTTGIDLRDFKLDQKSDIYGLQKWEKMLRQLERLQKVTVAAVEGECTGGGFQLVLLCDAKIALERSTFAFDEVKRGFLPGMAVYRLAKHIGLGRAKNLVLTGRAIGAEEALQWGLLDRVTDGMSVDDTLQETIGELLPFHPVAHAMARRLLNESFAEEYEDFLGHFLAAQHRAINSDAFKRLIAKASQ